MDYQRLGVERVINAAGRLTALGGVALQADVVAAMANAARYNVDMKSLKDRAGELIAELTGAEAAMVTTGAAAGICTMVAGVVAGTDEVKIRRLPDSDWDPSEIVLMAGHASYFGASVTQMIRVGGGWPVLVGDVNMITPGLLRGHLTPRTAGFLYIQSHHTAHKGMLSLEQCREICREKGVPLLIDAAAEEDMEIYLRTGCDLVTYSGGKEFGGPTSGFIAGRKELVEACRAQESGVARGMKVGKETILGLLAALESFRKSDARAEKARQLALIEGMEEGLAGLPNTKLTRIPDEAGRAIIRLGLTLDEKALGFTAVKLLKELQAGSPAVVLRGHWASTGTVAIDPRPLVAEDSETVVEQIRRAYGRLGGGTK